MAIINKKQKEKKVANFFAIWFNRTYSANYKATEDVNDEETDYILESTKNASPNLYLQITTCDHSVIASMVESRKHPSQIGEVFSPNHKKYILKAIEEKTVYSQEVQKKLILLVYSDFSRFNGEYLRNEVKKNCHPNHFQKIFFLELPRDNPALSSTLRDGNVIQLK